jgi:uracil-DNA glycosylase
MNLMSVRNREGGRGESFCGLVDSARRCTLCVAHLPHGVRPVFQLLPTASILVAGQAPGRKVHASGVPFDDASGERLRDWLGVSREVFYDPSVIAILPMGFCYPGTGTSGDLPPRPECAPTWRAPLLSHLTNLRLTLAIGQYAQDYHITQRADSLTATVQQWLVRPTDVVPLPHPSPRNNIWLSRNPWFASELLPMLRDSVREAVVSWEC